MLRKLFALLLLVLLPTLASAQTAAPVAMPTFFNASGAVCNACLLYTYAAGTSTPLSTFTDSGLLTAHANPIVLNSVGRPPAVIFLSATSYKFVLKTAGGSTIYSADNISAVPSNITGVSSATDIEFRVDTNNDGNNVFSFLNGTSVQKAVIEEDGDAQIDGNLTVGDATEADKAVNFDGNAQDFHVGLDDSADSLVIGRGTALGTTPAFTLTSAGALTLTTTGATSTITTTGAQIALPLPTAGGLPLTIFANNATLLTIQGIAAGADGQILVIASIGAGQVDLANQNGSATAANRIINGVTGTISLAAGSGRVTLMYDGTTARWRVLIHEQGAWITPTFAAGDYTGGGTQTWTVAAGDVTTCKYYLKGRSLTIQLSVATTTVGGAPHPELLRVVPGGFTSASAGTSTVRTIDNGTTAIGLGVAGAASASISFFTTSAGTANWAAATDTTGVQGTLTFEVQ